MNQSTNNGPLWSMNVYSPEGSNRMGVNRPVSKPPEQEARQGARSSSKPEGKKR